MYKHLTQVTPGHEERHRACTDLNLLICQRGKLTLENQEPRGQIPLSLCDHHTVVEALANAVLGLKRQRWVYRWQLPAQVITSWNPKNKVEAVPDTTQEKQCKFSPKLHPKLWVPTVGRFTHRKAR